MAEESKQSQQEGQQMPARREERGISRAGEPGMESPIAMVRRFHDEMDRMFDAMFSGFGLPMTRRRETMVPFELMQVSLPTVDVWETDQDVMIRADLPGVEPENIEIYTTEDSVRIRGEIKQEQERTERGFYRAERRYGRFERVIDLPSEVKPGEAKATFRHGVLEVRLPKTEQARERMKKVPVEVEEEQMAGAKGGRGQQQGQT